MDGTKKFLVLLLFICCTNKDWLVFRHNWHIYRKPPGGIPNTLTMLLNSWQATGTSEFQINLAAENFTCVGMLNIAVSSTYAQLTLQLCGHTVTTKTPLYVCIPSKKSLKKICNKPVFFLLHTHFSSALASKEFKS